YLERMRRLTAPATSWPAEAVAAAVRRFEAMSGSARETDVVFMLDSTPGVYRTGETDVLFEFFVQAFTARLTLQSGYVKPFDGHESFLSQEFYNNARLIDRHFGSKKGRVSLDLDWIGSLGLELGRLEGTSGGLAQAVLLSAGKRGVALPA